MAVFPMFVDLKGKKCVVVGGGVVALRKVETLLKFDAKITVISPVFHEKLMELKWEGSIVAIKKNYEKSDLDDVFLVIAATSDERVNEKIYFDAVKYHIPVNVVDKPQYCSFIFPSVVKRNDIVIGISTSGSYPILSRKLRERIEEIVSPNLDIMLETLKQCRKRALLEIKDPDKRKELLEKLLDELLFYEDMVTNNQLSLRIEHIFEEFAEK